MAFSVNRSLISASGIRLARGKTGARVMIPVGAPLKAVLDVLFAERKPRAFDRIVLNSRGEPLSSAGLSSSFSQWKTEAANDGLTFHDTRGTAMTRLATCGCTVPELATFTGHSLRDVNNILDAHYLNRDPALAESALKKLEARTKVPD